MTNTTQILPNDASDAFGDALPPGTTLCQDQYTIIQYLNSGGFGVTYLAHDSLGRRVVIKECYPGVMCCRSQGAVRPRSRGYKGDFERVVALFEKEARALARLQHPNIVGVHQIFKDNGTIYMALDFVEGPDLLQVLETDPSALTPAEIEALLRQILEALAYIHANGILHRDISPDNILLGSDGLPVLIDFGAARDDAARATRVLSRVQTVKDGYSPQEFYLAGTEQEQASDLYSLAATTYHLITGEAPPNSNLRLAAIAEKRPDPCEPLQGRVDGFDPYFLDAIDQCLNVFAKDRLQSAEAWLELIDVERRRQRALDAARRDEEIALRVSQLVSETQQALAHEPEQDTATDKANRPARPDPVEAERDYWAILNEDPAEIAAEIERAEAEAAARAAAEAALAAEPVEAPQKRGFWLWNLLTPWRRLDVNP